MLQTAQDPCRWGGLEVLYYNIYEQTNQLRKLKKKMNKCTMIPSLFTALFDGNYSLIQLQTLLISCLQFTGYSQRPQILLGYFYDGEINKF